MNAYKQGDVTLALDLGRLAQIRRRRTQRRVRYIKERRSAKKVHIKEEEEEKKQSTVSFPAPSLEAAAAIIKEQGLKGAWQYNRKEGMMESLRGR